MWKKVEQGAANIFPHTHVCKNVVSDRRNPLHGVRKCLHLDVGICVPAEVSEAALVVPKRRIDRRIVAIQDFLTGIALVVLGDEIR